MGLGGGFGAAGRSRSGLGTPKPISAPAIAYGGGDLPAYAGSTLGSAGSLTQGSAKTPNQVALDSSLDFYNAYFSPSMAGINAQGNGAAASLAKANAARGGISDAETQLADIRRRQLDNQLAGVDVDLAAIPRQSTLVDQLLGITGQQKDININQLGQDEATANRDWWNQVAAQGSSSAPETGLKLNDIKNTAENNRRSILLDWETANLNAAEQKAVLGDREKQLKLQADNYRLDKDALAASLASTLGKLNLDGIMSAGQVLDSINSKNAQKAQLANQILMQAIQDAPYFAPQDTRVKPSTGSGSSGKTNYYNPQTGQRTKL